MSNDIYGLGCYASSPLPAPLTRIISSSNGPISRAASIDGLSPSDSIVVSAAMPAIITITLTIFPEPTSSDVGDGRGITGGGGDGMELSRIGATGSSIPSQPSQSVTASSSISVSTIDMTSTSSADSSSSSSSSSTEKGYISASLCWNEYRAALLPCPTPTSSSSSSSASNDQLTKDGSSSSTSRTDTVRSSSTKSISAVSSWHTFSTRGFFLIIINIAAVMIAVIA